MSKMKPEIQAELRKQAAPATIQTEPKPEPKKPAPKAPAKTKE